MRGHLLRGRIRTSTVLIALVFVIALVTYLLVRPDPARSADEPGPTGTTSQPANSAQPSASPAPVTSSPAPPTTPPGPTPSATPAQSGRTSPAASPSG